MSTIRTIQTNRLITHTFIGTSIGVFAAWNYSGRGAVYRFLHDLPSISQQPLVPALPEPSTVRKVLERDFVFDSRHPEKVQTWILSALSHQNTAHCAFNLITLSSFASVLSSLSTRHFSAILFGSAFASAGTWLFEQRGKKRDGRAIGASGVVSGVLSTVTMLVPRLPVRLMFVLPLPLWVATAGYFVADTYMMTTSGEQTIGHSAHIGGGLFGVLYYLLFLRRFGLTAPRF